jgi:hypothetical protein
VGKSHGKRFPERPTAQNKLRHWPPGTNQNTVRAAFFSKISQTDASETLGIPTHL